LKGADLTEGIEVFGYLICRVVSLSRIVTLLIEIPSPDICAVFEFDELQKSGPNF
jgi:hypothetical protein